MWPSSSSSPSLHTCGLKHAARVPHLPTARPTALSPAHSGARSLVADTVACSRACADGIAVGTRGCGLPGQQVILPRARIDYSSGTSANID